MTRTPITAGEGKEHIRTSIDKYIQNILKHLPPDKRNRIIREMEEGRAVRFPRPTRE